MADWPPGLFSPIPISLKDRLPARIRARLAKHLRARRYLALTGHLRLNWCEPERAVVSRSYEQPLEHVEPAGKVWGVHRGLKDLLVARSAWACSSVPPQRSREAGPSLLLSYAVAGVVIFLIMWAFRAASASVTVPARTLLPS